MPDGIMKWRRFAGAGLPVSLIVRFQRSPIGLILCSEQDAAVAHYALGNLGNQVLAREYQLALPTEEQLVRRLEARRRQLDQ
jgi:hypothetical protein